MVSSCGGIGVSDFMSSMFAGTGLFGFLGNFSPTSVQSSALPGRVNPSCLSPSLAFLSVHFLAYVLMYFIHRLVGLIFHFFVKYDSYCMRCCMWKKKQYQNNTDRYRMSNGPIAKSWCRKSRASHQLPIPQRNGIRSCVISTSSSTSSRNRRCELVDFWRLTGPRIRWWSNDGPAVHGGLLSRMPVASECFCPIHIEVSTLPMVQCIA